MLQQRHAEDYVIATGEAHSVRECCEVAFDEAGLGDFEKYVTIDPAFVRPAEVDHLIGDPAKAERDLGWTPQTTFEELIRLMTRADLRRSCPRADRVVGVPLFDTSAPLAGLLRRDPRGDRPGARLRALHPRARGERLRAGVRRRTAAPATRVGVANGTDAITIALRAMGVGPGDEVIVPSFTFYASAEAIPPTGATPVFCDIDPETYCITAETRARGAHAAHQGRHRRPPVRQPGAGRGDRGARRPGPRGRRAGRRVAARRRAARARSATAATFSFFPSKNLGCFGDGGMITTSDEGDRRARAHAALPRLARQGHLRAGRLQLAPGRAAGGDPARAAAASGRVGRRPARAGAHYSEAGPGRARSGCRRPAAGCAPAWHLYVVATREVERARSAPQQGRGRARGPTTARRSTARRRCGLGAGRRAAHHRRRPRRTSRSRSAPSSREQQVAEVVAAARRVG